MKSTLKFFYNGIKVNGGALQKCSYSISTLISYPAGTITIYGKNYERFSKEIREAFTVENDTDSMTDYFDNDFIRVMPDHPLYSQIVDAHGQQAVRRQRNYNRYLERQGVAA